ncbi:polysaccharide deacetylase family protein [Sporosarcina gallistercoris]|uniref:Polysaccharide deacetylase family protein n=1 Tax=Sporosarcina gallistercoris TaxID=2762245 RepID=A0ABR8PII7_9BACL|nr:polysaccharide deacetylase family protein [Sporosarcina gallistercoris]MBD7907969.1 polysaccharide deacetylase family protein [Sporosarcina gallistercoris]
MKKMFGNRRFKLIDVLLTTIIVFLAMTAILLIFTKGSSDHQLKSAQSPSSDKDAVVVDKSDSKYEGIKIITETSNDPLGKYAVQYPQSKNEDFNNHVITYIKQAKKNYLQEISNVKIENNKRKSELNISYETHVDKKGNYSFVLMNNKSLQGSKRLSEIESFHLNSKSGEQLDIQAVFKEDPTTLKKITDRVREKIQQTDKLNDGLIADKMQIRTEPEWKNFENFAISEKSMIFYFESGSLKGEKAGPQIATIPIGDMNDLLKPEFQVAAAPPAGGDKVDKPDAPKKEESAGSKDTEHGAENESSKEEPEAGGETAPHEAEETHEKKIALTFDDGPDPKSTIQILDTLKKYDAKATFFMLGSRVEYYPDAAKAVKAAGHEIGNHSWNHPDLSKMPLAKALEEINRTTGIIQKVTGEKPTVFRPPYGAYTDQLSKQTIPPIILWNVDTLDWKYRDSTKLLEEVKKSTKEGSTILMHDIHQSTADGLDNVMAYLQSQGYKFVTVSELHR